MVLGLALGLAPDGTAVDRGWHGGAFGRFVLELAIDAPTKDLRVVDRMKVWGTRGGCWMGELEMSGFVRSHIRLPEGRDSDRSWAETCASHAVSES